MLVQVGNEVGEWGGGETTRSHSREGELCFRCTEKLLKGFRGVRNDRISFRFSKGPSSSGAKEGFREGAARPAGRLT